MLPLIAVWSRVPGGKYPPRHVPASVGINTPATFPSRCLEHFLTMLKCCVKLYLVTRLYNTSFVIYFDRGISFFYKNISLIFMLNFFTTYTEAERSLIRVSSYRNPMSLLLQLHIRHILLAMHVKRKY